MGGGWCADVYCVDTVMSDSELDVAEGTASKKQCLHGWFRMCDWL